MCTRARRATWCISLLAVGCLIHFLNEIVLLWSVSSPQNNNNAIAIQQLQHSVVVHHRSNHSSGDRSSTTTSKEPQSQQPHPPNQHRDIVHARYSYKAGFGSALVSLSGRLVQAARQGKRFRHEFTPGPWSYARGVCPQQDLSCYFAPPTLIYADENNASHYYPSNETEALKALLVLQPHMQAELDALSTPHPPQPCGVIHVRHADVTLNFDSNQSETPIFRYLSLEEHIRAFVKAAPGVRHVVLLTDDQDVVEQVDEYQLDNNNHSLVFHSLPRPRWRGAQGGYNGHIPSGNPKQEVMAILQELQMTRHCTAAWVGVSSSLGRVFRQLHPPQTVVMLQNKIPTTNHTLASRAFRERMYGKKTTDLPLRFRPGFLRPNISSVDTLRYCHAQPYLGANPNLAKTSRAAVASLSVPMSLHPSPTHDKQWIHRVVPNGEFEKLMQRLTLHNITHQTTEHPLPTDNDTLVFSVTQDPLVHLVQHFETLQTPKQQSQRPLSRKDVFAALQQQDSFQQPESFDKYVSELYQLRQRRPLDPRLPLQTRYLVDHDLDHIYTSAADALRQVWPHIPPETNNTTLPPWWNTVELATQQHVCELLLLDYCCLNRRLPPPCAGLFYCLLTSSPKNGVRIQPWNDPV